MSTFLDFAIGLSLVNGISGQISRIISDFKNLDGVTDETMKKLSQFKDISITGGLLAGAGVAGLKMTKDALDSCIDEAEKLQSVSTTLEIKAFGNDLLNESKLPQIKAQMEELEDTAMDVSLGTVFNQQQIEESMIAMIKGGMSKELVAGAGAESNAYFAQINEVDAKSTAQGTVKFAAGFQLEEDQIKGSLDLITRYADASIADALAIQQNIGNVAGSAMAVWKDRDNMQVAEETIQLVTATKYLSGDEASAATMTRNFLDEAGKTFSTMTETQVKSMMEAGWLQNATINSKGKVEDAKSIFINYDTGMLKSAEELEKILEETASKMDAVDFNNLLDTVFGDRGKKTAQALAQTGGSTDLATLKANAGNQLGIDEQVARQMETAAAQVGIFEESINTLKATLGKPFLEGKAAMFKIFNEGLATAISYFKEHPEVTKFIAAIFAGGSAFLLLVGTIMLLIGVIGALKTAFSAAGVHIIKTFIPAMPILLGVIAVVGIIAGLAFVIYKNWNQLKPQFQTLANTLSRLLKVIGNGFKNFGIVALPVLKELWSKFEKLALGIINIALPLITGALNFIIKILTGDFKGAWESLEPSMRIILIVGGPILAGLAVLLAIATVKTLALTAATLIHTAVTSAASVVSFIFKGAIIAATIAQTLWNVAIGTGTANTLLEKAAVIGFLPVIAAIKLAKIAWTGIQWALNAAMAANPIGIVILLIGLLIGVVVLVVTHFKDIVEWVGKAWDKLKGFLGFKKEAKEELEDPINVNINEGEKEEKVTVIPETKGVNQEELIKQITDGQGNFNVPLNLNMNNPEELQKFMQESGISSEGIDVGLNFDDSSGDYQKMLEQFSQDSTITPNMDMTEIEKQMAGFTGDMNMLGIEGTGELANGLSGADSLQSLDVSVDSINSTITDNLIKDEQMKIYGSNLIQSFINGINSKTAALKIAVEGVASIMGDYLAVHSPTKKGALHDNPVWGGNLIKSFIKGMKDKNSQLENNIMKVSNTISGIDSSFNDVSKNLSVVLNISREDIPRKFVSELKFSGKNIPKITSMEIQPPKLNIESAFKEITTNTINNLISKLKLITKNLLIEINVSKKNAPKIEATKMQLPKIDIESTFEESTINSINRLMSKLKYIAKDLLIKLDISGENIPKINPIKVQAPKMDFSSILKEITTRGIDDINLKLKSVPKDILVKLNISKENIPKNLTSELNISEKNIPKINPIEVQEPKMDFSSMLKNITTKGIDDINLKLKNISKDILVKLNISKEDIPKSLPIKVQPFQVDISSIANNIKSINKDNYNNNLKMPYISNENITNNHEENAAPIYIIINGGDKKGNEIAEIVIKELEKHGLGKKNKNKMTIDSSLVKSNLGFAGGQ